jgi:hypothetical protein
MFNFMEALEQLKKGKQVRRIDWQDGYLVLMPKLSYVWRIMVPSATVPQANAGNYLPLVSDMLSNDWVIVTEDEQIIVDPEPVTPPAA